MAFIMDNTGHLVDLRKATGAELARLRQEFELPGEAVRDRRGDVVHDERVRQLRKSAKAARKAAKDPDLRYEVRSGYLAKAAADEREADVLEAAAERGRQVSAKDLSKAADYERRAADVATPREVADAYRAMARKLRSGER